MTENKKASEHDENVKDGDKDGSHSVSTVNDD
jgi:hypothetical protein